MKKIFSGFAVTCIALMFIGCGGGATNVDKTPLCPEVSVVKVQESKTVVPDSPVVRVNEPVMFDFDSDVIRDDQIPNISNVAEIMKDNSDVVLKLEGYASIEGAKKYNLGLSERRAKSVKNTLVDFGISSDRISTIGMGETTQFGEELSLNRRVLILYIK